MDIDIDNHAVVPGFDRPIDRILFFMQIGRTDEAQELAEWWLGNLGWNNYEHAVAQARQRALLQQGIADPGLQARQDYENEFQMVDDDRVILLNAIGRGYAQRGALEGFEEMFARHDYGEDYRQWKAYNEQVGTMETLDWNHVRAMNDITNSSAAVFGVIPGMPNNPGLENQPPLNLPFGTMLNPMYDIGNAGRGTALNMRRLG